MKNSLLILCFFTLPIILFGQSKIISPKEHFTHQSFKEPELPSFLTNPVRNSSARSANDTTWHWISYWQIVDAEYNTGVNTAIFIWPDSTVKLEYSNGYGKTGYHGYSDVFDPSSALIDNRDLNVGEEVTRIGFNDGSGYIVDSVLFYFLYKRVTALNILDTLFVYTFDMNNIGVDESICVLNDSGTYKRSWVNYDRANNRPSQFLTTDTILLDTAYVNSGNIYRLMVLPIDPVQLAAGEKMGLAFKYEPGTPYNFGDTVYSYVQDTPVGNNNTFRLGSYCENFDGSNALYPLTAVDDYPATNSGAAANYQALYGLDGWGNEYLNAMMWSCQQEHWYQHGMTWYHTAPIGLDFSYTIDDWVTVNTVEDYSNFNPTSWVWTFTDSNQTDYTYQGQTASHTFDKQGVYKVCVTGTNDAADSYTKCKNVTAPPVGVSNPNNEAINITIKPNPVISNVTINHNGSSPNDFNIKIIDILGTSIYDEDIENTTSFTKNIDLSSYANGIYFVRIMTDNGITSHKLILAK